jgi:hypothetical protein
VKPRIFTHWNKGLGDTCVLCAAASQYSRETGADTFVSFWGAFKGWADYFDGVKYITPELPDEYKLSPRQREQFEVIDTGVEPHPPQNFNKVSWELKAMRGKMGDGELRMNVSAYPVRDRVSIVQVSHTNGPLSNETLRTMLARARIFYPDHTFQLVGHRHNWAPHEPILREFGVIDNRCDDDRTVHRLVEELRRSDLLISPHSGPVYPALALGLRVWCEASKRPYWDYWLDFPTNRPFFFRRP